MLVHFKPMCVLAPAKINLHLSVEGKRSDGYHDICTVMYAVSLYDLLVLNVKESIEISVTCDHPSVPDGELNLVYKAICFFLKELGRVGTRYGVSAHIRKRIPVGAGFGGGSSNAASTLLFLNNSFGFPFSTQQLSVLGRRVGADVPFFLFGRPAIAMGVGDFLNVFRCRVPNFALLVCTGIEVSTSWAYENLRLNRTLGLTKSKKKLSKFDYRHDMSNDLESVTEAAFPVVAEVKSVLLNLGASGVLMSGSGSGVFGLFEDLKTVITAWRFILRRRFSDGWSAYVVRLLSDCMFFTGASSSGKTQDFDSCIRRFESSRPSQFT